MKNFKGWVAVENNEKLKIIKEFIKKHIWHQEYFEETLQIFYKNLIIVDVCLNLFNGNCHVITKWYQV